MKKVLHVLTGAHTGGISTVVLNYYLELYKKGYLFDLAITKDAIGINGKKLIGMGCKIFKIPPKSKNLYKYCKYLKKILREGNYDIIHVHENYTSFIALFVAKKCNVSIRIAHAHTSQNCDTIIMKFRRFLSRTLNPLLATNLIACSKDAANCLFGNSKKITVIPNGVDLKKYAYSESKRNSMRKSLKINNDIFVLGSVGRLSKEKNQKMLIELFEKFNNIIHKSLLIIVGDGNDKKELEEIVNKKSLQKKVLFLGVRDDVNDILNMFDVFLLPSLYEGFGIAAAEALANGLYTVVSDSIPHDLDIYNNCYYVPLNNMKEWINKIIQVYENKCYLRRKVNMKDTIVDLKYDIYMIEEIYSKRRKK